MALVAAAGHALGRDAVALAARGRLQQRKRLKRTACWTSGAPSIATSLRRQKSATSAAWSRSTPVVAGGRGAVERAIDAREQVARADLRRPVVGDVLRTGAAARPRRGRRARRAWRRRPRRPARAPRRPRGSTRCSIPHASSRPLLRVASRSAARVPRGARRERHAAPSPRSPSRGAGRRRRRGGVRHELGGDRDARRPVERLDLVVDRDEVAVGQRREPARADRHAPRRARSRTRPRATARPSACRASARSEQARGGEVERLVVDEQPDDRAVGGVDDRLPGPREAVGVLGVHDRPRLVEAVEDHAGVVRRRALVGRAAHAEVAVADREHGLERGAARGAGDRTRARVIAPVARSGCHLREVVDDDVGAGGEQRLGRGGRGRRRATRPNPPARPAATPASGVLDHDGARAGGTPRRRGGLEEAVGRRLAAQPEPLDVAAVDGQVEQPVDAGRAQHGAGVRARGHDGGAHAGGAQLPHPADRAGERLDAAARRSAASTSACLSVADAPDRRAPPAAMPRAREEVAHAVLARLAVDVGDVVALGVERRLRRRGEERVEGLLPGCGVQPGRRGEDAVEVEQDGVVVGVGRHRWSLRSARAGTHRGATRIPHPEPPPG